MASNTRDRILKTLLNRQRCSINDLADAVGINPISVRHHISKLEADHLVTSEEVRHGVGRPRRMYSLTDGGREQFPTRYLSLTNRLLKQLKKALPNTELDTIFELVGQNLVSNYAENVDIEDLTMEERLELLKRMLAQEGFQVEWELKGTEYHIKELNCPYYQIGISHPEVCSVDQTVISSVLDVDAQKIQCILDGDKHCAFVVPRIEVDEISVLNS